MWQQLQELYSSPDPALYAIPFFLLCIALELYVARREHLAIYQTPDSVASITMGIGSIITTLITKSAAFFVFIYLYNNYRLFDIPVAWWSWVLLLFADDFSFYWHHRLSHEVRLLWAAHVNHHSSEKYNLSTALRQSWTEEIYKFAFWLWLPLLGFHPLFIFMQMSISLIYQFWIHTQVIKRLPNAIELVFNTPSHHRVHHASNVCYLDRNYAGILIIWDRFFGTFAPENPAEPVIYGITTNIHTFNPLHIASHEFVAIAHDLAKAKSWQQRINHLLKPPGWSADGSTQTAKQMQERLKMNS